MTRHKLNLDHFGRTTLDYELAVRYYVPCFSTTQLTAERFEKSKKELTKEANNFVTHGLGNLGPILPFPKPEISPLEVESYWDASAALNKDKYLQ